MIKKGWLARASHPFLALILKQGHLIFAFGFGCIKGLIRPADDGIFGVDANGLGYSDADGDVEFREQRIIDNFKSQGLKFFSG